MSTSNVVPIAEADLSTEASAIPTRRDGDIVPLVTRPTSFAWNRTRYPCRGIPRHGHRILLRGAEVGQVTSGTMSPSLRVGIALASVNKAASAIGTTLDVDIRGTLHPARVVKLPFL